MRGTRWFDGRGADAGEKEGVGRQRDQALETQREHRTGGADADCEGAEQQQSPGGSEVSELAEVVCGWRGTSPGAGDATLAVDTREVRRHQRRLPSDADTGTELPGLGGVLPSTT